MKGLSKGLKYISQFFENEKEDEFEIQIGAPTDVKHVAHIGNNGPFNNAPTWMNEFDMSAEANSAAPQPDTDLPSSDQPQLKRVESKDKESSKSSEKVDSNVQKSREFELPKPPGSQSREFELPKPPGSQSREFELPKPPGSQSDGPSRHNSNKSKISKRQSSDQSSSFGRDSESSKPRRHKSSNSDSGMRDTSDRPKRNKNLSGGAGGSDYSTQDSNGPPTKTKYRRKKTKSGDSTASMKSKGSSESLSEHFGNLDILRSEYESKERDDHDQNMVIEMKKEKVEDCLNDNISKEIRAL